MSKEEFVYIYDNATYKVEIIYRGNRQKNIYYRKNGDTINVSASSIRRREQILNGLPEAIRKLNARSQKKKINDFITSEGVYLLGEYQKFNNDHFEFMGSNYIYLNKEQLYKRLKAPFEIILKNRVAYYSKIMNVTTHYDVRVKSVKTIYGSNSYATKTLTFNSVLIHYSVDIIDSVVVHELAHDFVRNHSSKFYDVVLKTMPDYYLRDKKLRGGIVKWFNQLKAEITHL